MNALLALFILLSPTPAYHMTYADVLRFVRQDRTDKLDLAQGFGCIQFSETLVRNAQQRGFMATGELAYMALDDYGNIYGHEFVQFWTVDRGLVWIEPQTDDEYIVQPVGGKLCAPWGWCQDGRIQSLQSVLIDP